MFDMQLSYFYHRLLKKSGYLSPVIEPELKNHPETLNMNSLVKSEKLQSIPKQSISSGSILDYSHSLALYTFQFIMDYSQIHSCDYPYTALLKIVKLPKHPPSSFTFQKSSFRPQPMS